MCQTEPLEDFDTRRSLQGYRFHYKVSEYMEQVVVFSVMHGQHEQRLKFECTVLRESVRLTLALNL